MDSRLLTLLLLGLSACGDSPAVMDVGPSFDEELAPPRWMRRWTPQAHGRMPPSPTLEYPTWGAATWGAATPARRDASTGLEPILPTFDGTCPEFQAGAWNEFVAPDGDVTRAWLWYDESFDGGLRPFGFIMSPYTAEDFPFPAEPPPHNTMDESFETAGGVVVMVGPADRVPAFEAIDIVVACALDGLSLDPRRIHGWGLSRGASMAVSFGHQRANVASVAVFSSNSRERRRQTIAGVRQTLSADRFLFT